MNENSTPECDHAPLAILPGLLCDSRMFPGLQARFPGVMFVDGFYADASSISAMADYALARLPPRFALLGHSMGARVAIEIWKTAPKRVERIALADTGSHLPRPGEREKRLALRDIGREFGFDRLIAEWLPPMVAPQNHANADLMAMLEAMAWSAGQACFERQIEALLSRPAVDPVLAGIACPAFVIVGHEDQWSPIAQHRDIADAIPGAQLRIIPGAGHMAPAEAPGAFLNIVAEWLMWNPRPDLKS
jgi:pimeloyl-ACP methyl ester carboxylesterase